MYKTCINQHCFQGERGTLTSQIKKYSKCSKTFGIDCRCFSRTPTLRVVREWEIPPDCCRIAVDATSTSSLSLANNTIASSGSPLCSALESCCVSYYIFVTFRIIYLQLFVLYICNFSYYIYSTLFVLYICNFSYYIYSKLYVLYICNFSYYIYLQLFVLYIFDTFRIIYLQLFILYFCNFSYYKFDTLRIMYLQLRIIKSHFRIIKLGYVLYNLCSYCK